MAVIGVSHVAIGVRDMNRSLTFYRDVLGLRVRYSAVEHLPDLNEVKAVSRTAVFLEHTDPQTHPTSTFLVLDERPEHEQFGQPAEMFQLGIHHFSFWVDDIDAIVARGTAAWDAPVPRTQGGPRHRHGRTDGPPEHARERPVQGSGRQRRAVRPTPMSEPRSAKRSLAC